jgi:hypothetical protein
MGSLLDHGAAKALGSSRKAERGVSESESLGIVIFCTYLPYRSWLTYVHTCNVGTVGTTVSAISIDLSQPRRPNRVSDMALWPGSNQGERECLRCRYDGSTSRKARQSAVKPAPQPHHHSFLLPAILHYPSLDRDRPTNQSTSAAHHTLTHSLSTLRHDWRSPSPSRSSPSPPAIILKPPFPSQSASIPRPSRDIWLASWHPQCNAPRGRRMERWHCSNWRSGHPPVVPLRRLQRAKPGQARRQLKSRAPRAKELI